MKQKNKMYEIMFLLPAGTDTAETGCNLIRQILERYGAEIVVLDTWREGKLAYKIGQHRRGIHVLCYCTIDPQAIKDIEHDCKLNEGIIRIMVIRREDLTAEQAKEEFTTSAEAQKLADESALQASSMDSDDYGSNPRYRRRDSRESSAPEPVVQEAVVEESEATTKVEATTEESETTA